MEKLDRLVWATGFVFSVHGLRLGVRLNDATLIDDVRARLPAGARPASHARVDVLFSVIAPAGVARAGVRRHHLLYVDSARVTRTFERQELLCDVERFLEESIVVAAPRRLFLHAGAVGWKGRALVLPGASHAGKTTLVAELLKRGATYYSDELAIVDQRGAVHPFARPLRIRRQNGVEMDRVPPEELGAPTGRRPLPIALVALLSFESGARYRVRTVTNGRAWLELLRHAPSARFHPERPLRYLPSLLERARVVKGVRGEAAEAADRLLAMMEAS